MVLLRVHTVSVILLSLKVYSFPLEVHQANNTLYLQCTKHALQIHQNDTVPHIAIQWLKLLLLLLAGWLFHTLLYILKNVWPSQKLLFILPENECFRAARIIFIYEWQNCIINLSSTLACGFINSYCVCLTCDTLSKKQLGQLVKKKEVKSQQYITLQTEQSRTKT